MVFYVIVVTFPMNLLMNKFTSISSQLTFKSSTYSLIYLIYHPNIYVMKHLSRMIYIWMKFHLVRDNNGNIINIQCPIFETKNDKWAWFTFSVGDTVPHGQSTIIIEQDILNQWH
jgi:hypothetical protein